MKNVNQKGFSLLEILIAIALLGIVAGFVGGNLMGQLAEGRINATINQIKGFKGPLNDFRRHCNRYPTTEQGLLALVEKPSGSECKRYRPGGYMDGDEVPVDAWEYDFIYESDGRSYTIKSLGNDGAEGGEGEDADISSEDM